MGDRKACVPPMRLVAIVLLSGCVLVVGCASQGVPEPDTGVAGGRVYCVVQEAPGLQQIFSFASHGGDRRFVANGSFPGVSRVSSRVWFIHPTGQLWVMSPDGSNQRAVSTLPGLTLTPAESPDGTRVAVTYAAPGSTMEVWVMNTDGSEPRPLTRTTTAATTRRGGQVTWSVHASWSPDGKKIAYASTQGGSSQVWTIDADGAHASQLIAGSGPAYPDSNVPEYSLDGARIVYWSGFETEYGEVWAMDADGTHQRQLTETPDPHNSDNPTWSPDGGSVVFISNRPGGPREMNAWVLDLAGGEPRLLAAGGLYCAWQAP